jgi:small subunit ribosomal protein S6
MSDCREEVNALRTYEALYVVRPDGKDEDIQTIADEVTKLVTDNGGAIVRSEIWGKRKLAYEVKKFTEGVYVLLRFEADQSLIPKLETYYRLSEAVIRFLIVHFDEQALRLEELQERRKEAQVQAMADRSEEDEDRPVSRRRGRSRDDDDDEDDED